MVVLVVTTKFSSSLYSAVGALPCLQDGLENGLPAKSWCSGGCQVLHSSTRYYSVDSLTHPKNCKLAQATCCVFVSYRYQSWYGRQSLRMNKSVGPVRSCKEWDSRGQAGRDIKWIAVAETRPSIQHHHYYHSHCHYNCCAVDTFPSFPSLRVHVASCSGYCKYRSVITSTVFTLHLLFFCFSSSLFLILSYKCVFNWVYAGKENWLDETGGIRRIVSIFSFWMNNQPLHIVGRKIE